MFNNVGSKIKMFAQISFIIEVAAAICIGFVYLAKSEFEDAWWILLVIFLGLFVLLIGYWLLSGYGELIENSQKTVELLEKINRKQNVKGSQQIAEENEDEYECLNCKKTFMVRADEDTVQCPYCDTKYKLY